MSGYIVGVTRHGRAILAELAPAIGFAVFWSVPFALHARLELGDFSDPHPTRGLGPFGDAAVIAGAVVMVAGLTCSFFAGLGWKLAGWDDRLSLGFLGLRLMQAVVSLAILLAMPGEASWYLVAAAWLLTPVLSALLLALRRPFRGVQALT